MAVRAPEYVSEAIERDFKEAVNGLRSGNYTSAGMMFRKVLQRATATLDESKSLKNKKLYQRLEILAKRGIITDAMYQWAEIIRSGGNSANHDEEEYGEEEFTEEGAKQLYHFTEIFLTYVFTLPALVKTHSKSATDPV